MKKTALLVLLLLPMFSWSAPKPDEYTINVHVTSSRLAVRFDRTYPELNVAIGGRKYELTGPPGTGLVALGDYKAKLVKDEHKTTYESAQVYELLFPDKRTRRFSATGEFE